jgi:predicted RNA binding protein YcfA (HicA-like mRNA interferase family)
MLLSAYYNTHNFLTFSIRRFMSSTMGFETNTRKIIARLEREGWQSVHGGRHDKFEHPAHPEITLIVPRHREVSFGVARDIAKKAGWI